MLFPCSVSHSDVCAVGRFTFQSVTRSRGTKPFWNFTSRCHRLDKKDKHCGPIRTPYDNEFCEQGADGHLGGTGQRRPIQVAVKTCLLSCGVHKLFYSLIRHGKVAKLKTTFDAITFQDITTLSTWPRFISYHPLPSGGVSKWVCEKVCVCERKCVCGG